jgi:hypothetical protein
MDSPHFLLVVQEEQQQEHYLPVACFFFLHERIATSFKGFVATLRRKFLIRMQKTKKKFLLGWYRKTVNHYSDDVSFQHTILFF